MEVKIGVKQSPREVVLDSVQSQDEVESLVSAALTNGAGVLSRSPKPMADGSVSPLADDARGTGTRRRR